VIFLFFSEEEFSRRERSPPSSPWRRDKPPLMSSSPRQLFLRRERLFFLMALPPLVLNEMSPFRSTASPFFFVTGRVKALRMTMALSFCRVEGRVSRSPVCHDRILPFFRKEALENALFFLFPKKNVPPGVELFLSQAIRKGTTRSTSV